MINTKRTVVPIPPAYDAEEKLELNSTKKYLSFLDDNNIKTIMSTAGTSQFNFLTEKEIIDFNVTMSQNFSGQVLLGVPPLPTSRTKSFVKKVESSLSRDQIGSVNFLLLYNDRFYNEECLHRYYQEIRSCSSNPLYIHGNAMRAGTGGMWDYSSEVINRLHEQGVVLGIKEETSNLNYSYKFIQGLLSGVDVIVAGGSIRRYEFLKNAGANAFLSGVGNFYPWVENRYFSRPSTAGTSIDIENEIFKVFMGIGWHPSLRFALKHLGLTCFYNRGPWPELNKKQKHDIIKVLEKFSD